MRFFLYAKKGAKYPRLLSRGYFFTNEEEEIVNF